MACARYKWGLLSPPANNLAGIHNDIHRVGGVDPHEGGSVCPNNGFPGRMIGDTRHRQTVFSLEGGDGGGGLRAVNAVGNDAQMGGVILGNDPSMVCKLRMG